LSVPAADFLPARERSFRDERKEMAERWADLRDGVDIAIETVVGITQDEGAAHPRTKEEAAGCLMTEHSPPPARASPVLSTEHSTVSLDLKSSGSPWASGPVATGLDSRAGVERRSGEYSRRSNVVPPVSRGMTTAV
jgi:hypothetical protein